MLTIQPKFTQYSQLHKNNTSFKGLEDCEIPNDSYYKTQTNYYESQIKELDDLLDDEHTPKTFKKVLKGFRVISEGLLEGCAVAWGASKGAKVIKSTTMKGVNSKFVQKSIELLNPIAEGFKTTGSKFAKAVNSKFAEFRASKFATNVAEKVAKFTEKLENNKVGKYVVAGFRAIGKGLKWLGNKISKGASALKTKVKDANKSQIYDKTANVTSKTLGTGAGVAGAYNAATKSNVKDDGRIYSKNLNEDFDGELGDDFDSSELEDVESEIEMGE